LTISASGASRSGARGGNRTPLGVSAQVGYSVCFRWTRGGSLLLSQAVAFVRSTRHGAYGHSTLREWLFGGSHGRPVSAGSGSDVSMTAEQWLECSKIWDLRFHDDDDRCACAFCRLLAQLPTHPSRASGALLKVAVRPDPFLRRGRNVGNRTKAYLGSRNGGLICYTNLWPRSMQLARKLGFLKLS